MLQSRLPKRVGYVFLVEGVRNKIILERVMHDQDFSRLGFAFFLSVQRKVFLECIFDNRLHGLICFK